jgi:hypothetical protein
MEYRALDILHPTCQVERGECIMAATQKRTTTVDNVTAESHPRSTEIDPTAPAGSKDALGAESIRDGRPATDDSTVEAIDEEGPGISAPLH